MITKIDIKDFEKVAVEARKEVAQVFGYFDKYSPMSIQAFILTGDCQYLKPLEEGKTMTPEEVQETFGDSIPLTSAADIAKIIVEDTKRKAAQEKLDLAQNNKVHGLIGGDVSPTLSNVEKARKLKLSPSDIDDEIELHRSREARKFLDGLAFSELIELRETLRK